jgi:tRNA modification GTPase
MLDDTIAAIATPLGEGGLSVIRISGPQTLNVADRCFVPVGKNSRKPTDAATHTVQFGRIVRDGKQIDEVLLTVMRAPRTYTREDVVEIACHGGILSTKTVLDTVLANGARLAEPGEFTKRAFLNGRIDLTQAEAVADLIHSRTELALSAANEQLAGKLSQRINALRDDLMNVLAHVEAHIDFPDEDIAPDTREGLEMKLGRSIRFMNELLSTANEGQILRRGVRAAIVGRPNSGKSSLLNQLLGRDRAIVSPIPGTTRDTIEEIANVRGLPVVFIDTAGLREAQDEIESEGIRRSHASLERAEFILHVLDASEPLTAADEKYLAEFANKKRILVRNKIDLAIKLEIPSTLSLIRKEGDADESLIKERVDELQVSPDAPARLKRAVSNHYFPPVIDVCCLSGNGIEPLKDAIKELIWSGEIKAGMLEVMINARHKDALRRAEDAAVRTLAALAANLELDLVAVDLHVAVNAVGEVVGKTSTEDLLDSIFRQFCIGK